MIDQRDVEHAVVGYGTGGLSITWATTDAHGHYFAVDDVAVNLDMHLILHTVEDHKEDRHYESKSLGTQEGTSLTTKIHNVGNKANIDTVEEVTVTAFSLLVLIADTAQSTLRTRRFNSQSMVCSRLPSLKSQ